MESFMVSCSSINLKLKWMTQIIDCSHMLKKHSRKLIKIINKNKSSAIPIEIPVTYMLNCMYCNLYIKKKKKRRHCGYCARLCCEKCCNGKNKLPSKLNVQMEISVCNKCYVENQSKEQISSFLLKKKSVFHEERFANELKEKCITVNFNAGVKDISAIKNIDLVVYKRRRETVINAYREAAQNGKQNVTLRGIPPPPKLFQLYIFVLYYFLLFLLKK